MHSQSYFEFYPDKATLEDLLHAYFDCRKNKRNTMNALEFEADYEEKLITLRDEINSGSYQPGRSIAFIVKKPVVREIFTADFRDRVVHHWLINKLNPFFEVATHHKPTQTEKQSFLSSFYSYLGHLKHFHAFQLYKKMLFRVSWRWLRVL